MNVKSESKGMRVRVESRELTTDYNGYTDYKYMTQFYVENYVEYLMMLQKIKDGELDVELFMPPYKSDFDEEDFSIDLDNFCIDLGSHYREPTVYVYVTKW